MRCSSLLCTDFMTTKNHYGMRLNSRKDRSQRQENSSSGMAESVDRDRTSNPRACRDDQRI
ncbi:MAG TPA: hypothetical protein PLQ01_09955 [Methanothrix sp.]|nr:hypothetical protein [Methanothrix sp.]HOV82982.1 hypothetical protein [Methanothrix sp.]HPC89666.1 hypothetical protein [Methanothrix sp.]HQI67994.1 hypothetical protein [Methanothrix sp.]HRS84920.1 hypothetical protein [Methanothrix sp.]